MRRCRGCASRSWAHPRFWCRWPAMGGCAAYRTPRVRCATWLPASAFRRCCVPCWCTGGWAYPAADWPDPPSPTWRVSGWLRCSLGARCWPKASRYDSTVMRYGPKSCWAATCWCERWRFRPASSRRPRSRPASVPLRWPPTRWCCSCGVSLRWFLIRWLSPRRRWSALRWAPVMLRARPRRPGE